MCRLRKPLLQACYGSKRRLIIMPSFFVPTHLPNSFLYLFWEERSLCTLRFSYAAEVIWVTAVQESI